MSCSSHICSWERERTREREGERDPCLQNEDTGQHATEEEDHFNSWGEKRMELRLSCECASFVPLKNALILSDFLSLMTSSSLTNTPLVTIHHARRFMCSAVESEPG